ncbi:MAG: twin-arginine translocase subunit TatC [Proteobacteria bacterium]|nr:twin-arginine translocase subunit TatC [Pseudomonadota bacterium]
MAETTQKQIAADAHDEKVDSDEQPFLSHLIELRARILRGLVTVLVLFFPIYFFSQELYTFVAAPLMASLPDGGNMIATDVATPFITPLKLSIYAALFAGMPILLHQIWSFVSPGLYLHEKKFAVPLLVSSITLFYLGMAFAYYIVFPVIFAFMAAIAPEGVTMMTDISRYLDFVLKMFFAFGFAFEIPIATLLMVWSGISTADSLARKRPYLIVGCFVLGMLLTPPDVVSQLLLAIPMWILFEVGVFFARFIEQRDQNMT